MLKTTVHKYEIEVGEVYYIAKIMDEEQPKWRRECAPILPITFPEVHAFHTEKQRFENGKTVAVLYNSEMTGHKPLDVNYNLRVFSSSNIVLALNQAYCRTRKESNFQLQYSSLGNQYLDFSHLIILLFLLRLFKKGKSN